MRNLVLNYLWEFSRNLVEMIQGILGHDLLRNLKVQLLRNRKVQLLKNTSIQGT